jgi:glucose-1-phosphate adenylyltransferase
MDYGKMLDSHVARGAALSVGAIEVTPDDAPRFGILEVAEDYRLTGFQEKPTAPALAPTHPNTCLASMGIYVFDTPVLEKALTEDAEADTSHDFGKDILPRFTVPGERAFAYLFWDENKKESKYWRDVGTLDAYYEASMDLVQVAPVFNLYDPAWPLRTYQPQFPPAKFVFRGDDRRGFAEDSLVSKGCIISGSVVRGSILAPGVRVHSYGQIEDSILMADVTVNRHARIRRAIVDENVQIPRGAVIGYDADEDRRRHTVSEGGVVVVTPGEECYVDPAYA